MHKLEFMKRFHLSLDFMFKILFELIHKPFELKTQRGELQVANLHHKKILGVSMKLGPGSLREAGRTGPVSIFVGPFAGSKVRCVCHVSTGFC